MKTAFKRLAALVLASAVGISGIVPAQAMSLPRAPVEAKTDVAQVQYRRYDDRYYYHNGYRGYPHRRPGYRYHNGAWFPLAAFAAGAIIGGAIASQQPAYRAPRAAGLNPRHYQWCANRYRSYDSYSNTFQPYGGPRQQCLSPYY
jgi:hypothetical protein